MMSTCIQMVMKIMLFLALGCTAIKAANTHFSVEDYGATGNGTDDSKAFLAAWAAACNSSAYSPTVLVPPYKSFLLKPLTFQGPCKASRINLMISGKVVGPPFSDGGNVSQWIAFQDVKGLSLYGFGTVDGNGKTWWDHVCRDHPKLKNCIAGGPPALMFVRCNKTNVNNLLLTNTPQTHIFVLESTNFTAHNLVIDSPGYSPNTDGIHIHSSSHVIITNCKIGCGDDCISIGDYIFDIQIRHVQCGPGHGISVGSLGRSGNFVQVEKISVEDSSFSQTTNGSRIKTWQVGRGHVQGVTFKNLTFYHVDNPVIIDQNYCDIRGECRESETGVQIRNVIYKDFNGTSQSDIAINLNCSNNVPCLNITMDSINLEPIDEGKVVTANCTNAHGIEKNVVPGPYCLLP